MAEFLNWKHEKGHPAPAPENEDGFNAMGKPVPAFRRTAALAHCRVMGLTDTGRAMACVDGMANALQRDEPYQAMEAGMKYLDLTGVYRLMAVLLTAVPESVSKEMG